MPNERGVEKLANLHRISRSVSETMQDMIKVTMTD